MRDERLELTLTPEEKALLRGAAEREGLSLAAWARSVLLRTAREAK